MQCELGFRFAKQGAKFGNRSTLDQFGTAASTANKRLDELQNSFFGHIIFRQKISSQNGHKWQSDEGKSATEMSFLAFTEWWHARNGLLLAPFIHHLPEPSRINDEL